MPRLHRPAVAALAWFTSTAAAAPPASDPVLDALQAELDATMAAWEGEELPPYFLGYRATDSRTAIVEATAGTLDRAPRWTHHRWLDVQARVGDHAVDSSRRLRGDRSRGWNGWDGVSLPVDDDLPALRHAIWTETEQAVQEAREAIVRVRTNLAVKVDPEDDAPDFSQETPVVDLQPRAEMSLDLDTWGSVLVDASRVLADAPEVLAHELTLYAEARDEWIVTTEGTRIRQPWEHVRLSARADVQAPDGMRLSLYRWTDLHSPDGLPDPGTIDGWVHGLRDDAIALRNAPAGEPWSGPVLMRGRAAGVFIHEVIGHRSEGHRQKSEDEGQTFKDLVGEVVTSPAISIYDDPRVETLGGEHLNGHYDYDQEGVPAQRADIVTNGVYTGFLMSRTPLPGIERSNGHGRAQRGRSVVSRMANTVVETSDPWSDAKLKEALLAEVKRRGVPYGYIVDELAGGFTLTGRMTPNSFNIRAVTAWRVHPDGTEELVRGIDLVGTPLAALRNLVAAGDHVGVFNGYCGAESGSVPNAAVSPPLLIRALEVQRKETDVDRPPLLPKPGTPAADRVRHATQGDT